ncbi:DinB family protein [Halomonas chromatireducens]|uniref:DinB superfamily protein n=1 Tax=Halomonas chromatireducens TaxID=507626 RepID=A0A0X8HCV3_9GAMM|nr:DinB family protein [Halomonas chromatireducens]AMD00300.1 DinB superfamily protein [Halomonas chromatireducens]
MSSIINQAYPPQAGLIEENLLALSQLEEFLDALTPEQYRHNFGHDGRHTLGKHIRHIIDHYNALLSSLDDDVIDYEDRPRDERLEQWPQQAVDRLTDIKAELIALVGHCPTGCLSLNYPLGSGVQVLDTSLARELAFLTSHTIHHMAIVGLLADQLGITLPEAFGVHPSTLRHCQRDISRPVAAWPA